MKAEALAAGGLRVRRAACCSPVVCFQDAEKAGLNASAASRGHRVSARGTAQGWIRGGSRRPAGAPSPSRPPRQGGVEAPSRRLGQLGGRRPGCPGFWYARPVQTRAVESASARLAKRPPSSREPGESRAAARAPARPPGRPLPPASAAAAAAAGIQSPRATRRGAVAAAAVSLDMRHPP